MLVLKLADGSSYVFPTLPDMIKDIEWISTKYNEDKIDNLKRGLTSVAKVGGTAEVARLKYLKKVIAFRRAASEWLTADVAAYPRQAYPSDAGIDMPGGKPTPGDDGAKVVGVSEAIAKSQESAAAQKALTDFMNSQPVQKDEGRGEIQNSAHGKQAFDIFNIKYFSDVAEQDRANFAAGRAQFYIKELDTANVWIDAKLKFWSAEFAVR